MVTPSFANQNGTLLANTSSGITLKDISAEIAGSSCVHSPQVLHAEILGLIVSRLQPINFAELAFAEGDPKLLQKHYVIYTVDEVLRVANAQGWDLCKMNGSAYLFNGAYWKPVPEEDLEAFLGNCAQRLGVRNSDGKHFKFRAELVKQFHSAAYLKRVEALTGSVPINLLNGTLQVEGGKFYLRAPSKEDFLTYQLPFAYDKAATCPRFQAFLDRVLPDKACQHLLAEYIGYLFIPSSVLKLEKVLLLYGSGANGKSVFFEVINAMLGSENICQYSLQMLTDVERGGPYRAKLAGKLVNYGSEITSKMNTTQFKNMVSGEPIEVRPLYREPYTISNYAKLLFNCNELPSDVEHNNGYHRRFLIVPFDVTIPDQEQDPELSQKILSQELPGVLNWVLEGMLRLIAQKRFTQSELVTAQLEEFKMESDTVRMFLAEERYEKGNDRVQIHPLWMEYETYCIGHGHKHPCTEIKFSKRLVSLGYTKDRNGAARYFLMQKKPR